MTWLTPLTGLIVAAVVIPPLILLYFLKLRRRPKPIACTLLWKRSVEDLQANAPFQRLRRNLLLFLQLLALILLALSVMQPQILASRGGGGRTVLLIDNSASMTATDVDEGETRLEEAKRRARERVEALYSGGLFSRSPGSTMVIAFSEAGKPMCPFSDSKRELLEAIDSIRPTHGGTKIEEAIKLARAKHQTMVNEQGEAVAPTVDLPTIELLTDGRIEDLAAQAWPVERLIYHRIGSADADNVSISTIDVQRPYDRPTSVQVFAALLNHGSEAATCDLELTVDGRAMALETIELPAAGQDDESGFVTPGRNNVVFTPFEQPRGAVIGVRNLREDDMAADNAARVVVPPPRQLDVGLVATKSALVRTALEGMPLRSLELLSEAQFEALARSGSIDPYDVIVFDNYAPPSADLMPSGRYLCLGATPPVDGLDEFGTHDAQIVLRTRNEHPALRFIQLDKLYISECRLVQPDEDIVVLADGSQGPIILEVSRVGMNVLLVTFDPLKSNWPFLRSFPAFLFNAVEYLGNVGSALTSKRYEVGAALTTRLPDAARAITLLTPEGDRIPISAMNPQSVSWGPIRLAGLYEMTWTEGEGGKQESRSFAVNLLSEREGRIGVVDTLAVGAAEVSGRSGEAAGYVPLWPYAVGLVLALLMFEWWVYHRKTYI